MPEPHGHFVRSSHGQFVRSPHGQFNDERPIPPFDPTFQLLLVAYIDESSHITEEFLEGSYVGLPPVSPLPGVDRWRRDVASWEAIVVEFPVIGLVVLPGGGDAPGVLNPPGFPFPSTYIALTGAPRPIETMTSALKVGAGQAAGKFQTQHGVDAHIRGVTHFVDESGSMTRSDVPHLPGINGQLVQYFGEQPPDGLGVLADTLYPPPLNVPTDYSVQYPRNERWLYWMVVQASLVYRLPIPPW